MIDTELLGAEGCRPAPAPRGAWTEAAPRAAMLCQTLRPLANLPDGVLSQTLVTVQADTGQIEQLASRLGTDALQRIQQPGTEALQRR